MFGFVHASFVGLSGVTVSGFQVVEDENGEAVIEWLGELDEEISFRSLRKRNTPKIDRAIKFLKSTLSTGPVSSSTIKSLAEQEGIKLPTHLEMRFLGRLGRQRTARGTLALSEWRMSMV